MEKDLGVNINNELIFSTHIEGQVNKASKRLGLIRRSFEFLDAEAMKQLFVAVVRPNLEFGNVVWSPNLKRQKFNRECSKTRNKDSCGLERQVL
jgi:hypothetical protein